MAPLTQVDSRIEKIAKDLQARTVYHGQPVESANDERETGLVPPEPDSMDETRELIAELSLGEALQACAEEGVPIPAGSAGSLPVLQQLLLLHFACFPLKSSAAPKEQSEDEDEDEKEVREVIDGLDLEEALHACAEEGLAVPAESAGSLAALQQLLLVHLKSDEERHIDTGDSIAPEPDIVEHGRGYLILASTSGAWKRRWFQIEGTSLVYYDKQGMKLKKVCKRLSTAMSVLLRRT